MITRFVLPLLLAGLSLVGDAFAQEQATTNRATDLRERPAMDARSLAALPVDAPVSVVSRQGGWTQVQAGTQRGWVRAFPLRFQSTVETSSSGSGVGSSVAATGAGEAAAVGTSVVAGAGSSGRQAITTSAPTAISADHLAIREIRVRVLSNVRSLLPMPHPPSTAPS